MDPTKVHAIDQHDDPRCGAIVRIHVVGTADAVIALPSTIKTEAEATVWLFKLGMKMSGIDPHVEFTDEESGFMQAIYQCAVGLCSDGLEWKTLKVLNQAEIAGIMAATKKGVQ